MWRQLPLMVGLVAVIALASEPMYYALSWRGKLPDAYRTLSEFRPGKAESGSLANGETDSYVLRLRRGDGIVIDARSSAFDAMLRLEVLRDSAPVLVGTNDDGGNGQDARMELCAESTGVYVVTVIPFARTTGGAYRLEARKEQGDCVAMQEARRQREEADRERRMAEARSRTDSVHAEADRGEISLTSEPQVRTGELGSDDSRLPDDRPYESYRMACGGGTRFTLEVQSNDFDAYAMVEDPSGATVASDDDSGGGRNARLAYTCSTSGEYRLIATRFGSATGGRYTLRVTMQDSGVPRRPGA